MGEIKRYLRSSGIGDWGLVIGKIIIRLFMLTYLVLLELIKAINGTMAWIKILKANVIQLS